MPKLDITYVMLGYRGHASWQEAYPQAKQAARRATELDSTLSEAHVADAWVRLCYDWDFEGTKASLRHALEHGPNNELAHLARAMYRSWILDDQDASLAAARTALAIDPISPFTNSSVAWMLLFARRYEEAARHAEETLGMFPDALQALVVLAWTRVADGRLADALGMFERAAAASPDPITLGFVGHLYGRVGREADARAIIDRLSAGDAAGHVPVKSLVSIYAGLGDADRAFEWLDRGLSIHDGGLLALDVLKAQSRCK